MPVATYFQRGGSSSQQSVEFGIFPDDLVYLFFYLRLTVPPVECSAGACVGVSVGGFVGLGHCGVPDQLALPIGAIIQHKTGDAILDCGANTDGNSVFFELFDLASFGNVDFFGFLNGGRCVCFSSIHMIDYG
jgi:hypothetical protein